MKEIAVFVNSKAELCHFFAAERFVVYEKKTGVWSVAAEADFTKLTPSTPAETRKNTEALLLLLEGCDILAGGGITGIPFAVFDRAGFRIFEIGAVNDETLDGIIDELAEAKAAQAEKAAVVENARPLETATPGIYALDLIALQSKYPEISSKMAMRDFLEKTPFMELHLKCRHVPPWLENAGKYEVRVISQQGEEVNAIITKRC
jgi:predicted Fe-Mo cluster-binding NifX family protein